MKSFDIQYAPFIYGFLPLRYKYCPKHQFSKAPSLCYSLRATNQIFSPPYKLQTPEHFCLFSTVIYTARTQHLIPLGARHREKSEKGTTVPVWATKAYMGIRRNIPFILHFGSVRRWVTYCTSCRPGHFSHAKEHQCTLGMRQGGPQSKSGRFKKERAYCHYWDLNPGRSCQ